MKNSIYSILFFFLFLGVSGFAQEENLDKYPEPIGGIEEMVKNLDILHLLKIQVSKEKFL